MKSNKRKNNKMRNNSTKTHDGKWNKYRKLLKEQDVQWIKYKETLKNIPSYLILQKASDLILDYAHEKRPIEVSWFDKEDDFIELWQKLEQMSNDIDKIATIDKALKTVRSYDPDELP